MDLTSDASAKLELSRACAALWTATLSLMAAFMHTAAPAHRLLLARRIARNLATLCTQEECYTVDCRATFLRLSKHWNEKADRLSRQDERPRGGIGLLRPGWF